MGFQDILENGRYEMKINTQILPGSDFPLVEHLESQRMNNENQNLV